MSKLRKVLHGITILTALGLVLTIIASSADWTYIIDNPVKGINESSAITFLFPRPLGPLDFNGPRKSESLWGAGYKAGDVRDGVILDADSEHIDKVDSVAQSKQNLLVSYTALNLQINSYAETKLLISFEITFCLAPSLIEKTSIFGRDPRFPFADEYSITRNGQKIGSGVIYCEDSGSTVEQYKDGINNVALVKDTKEEAFTYDYFFGSRDYYYYTATINAEVNGFNVEDFVVDPPEPGSEPNYASFILDIKHNSAQENTIASFATVKVIATEYPAADSSAT